MEALVDFGKAVLDRVGGNGVIPISLIEERLMWEEARAERILRRVLVGVAGHKIWSVADLRMKWFYGLARWERQIVGGRETPDYGFYEIWSQVSLEPNAGTRILIISGEDEIHLDESEWGNRKICEQALREIVTRPAKMTTHAMDFFAGNNWSNPYWQGTDITHLTPLKTLSKLL